MENKKNKEHQSYVYSFSFEFIGDKWEYFKIWLVNMALTIITLGLYFPWAIIRKRQYLYQHTLLAGLPFEFTANPWRLFKGNLIVMAYIGAMIYFNVFQHLLAYSILLVALIILLPILIWLTYRFRLRYSVWASIPFNFNAKAGDFYVQMLIYGILRAIPFVEPYAFTNFNNYLISNISWGKRKLSAKIPTEPIFIAFLITIALYVGGLIFVMIIMFILFFSLSENSLNDSFLSGLNFMAIFSMIFVYVLFILVITTVQSYYSAVKDFYRYNSIKIDEARFNLNLPLKELVKLYVKIRIISIITLGLATPILKIELLKTIFSNAEIIAPTEDYLDILREKEQEEISSLGEMALDSLDLGIDFNLGL